MEEALGGGGGVAQGAAVTVGPELGFEVRCGFEVRSEAKGHLQGLAGSWPEQPDGDGGGAVYWDRDGELRLLFRLV